MAALWLIPALLYSGKVGAVGQLVSRNVSLSSGVPGATTVTYTYTFTNITSASIQSIKFVACTSAVATYAGASACTGAAAPTGMNINLGTQASLSMTNATGFTRTAGSGGCTAANNELCITRTQALTETPGVKSIGWNTQTNPSSTNTAFYIGIFLYSDAAWATLTDSGTVASAVVQTLTINAAVAEILALCVGSTTVNDATTSVASDCTGVSGTSLNIGTLDTGTVNISPVNTNGGDNKNGVVMVRSNAQTGIVVSYDAVLQAGTNHTGALREASAVCSASVVATDPCINSAGVSQAVFSAGTEDFGMTVGGVNCGSVTPANYTCVYSSGSNNLQQATNYVGGTNATTYGASAAKGFAWDETGASQTIATSASSTIKAVDDEALILRFGATPSVSTPFGAYAAKADFTAVATY